MRSSVRTHSKAPKRPGMNCLNGSRGSGGPCVRRPSLARRGWGTPASRTQARTTTRTSASRYARSPRRQSAMAGAPKQWLSLYGMPRRYCSTAKAKALPFLRQYAPQHDDAGPCAVPFAALRNLVQQFRLGHRLPDLRAAVGAFIGEVDLRHAPMRCDVPDVHRQALTAWADHEGWFGVVMVDIGWHVGSPTRHSAVVPDPKTDGAPKWLIER